MTGFELPLVCRYGWVYRLFLSFFSIVFFCLGLFLTFGGSEIGIAQTPFTFWFGLVFALVAPASTLLSLYGSLTLMGDRLIFQGYFRKYIIMREDILKTSNCNKSMNIISLDLELKGKRTLLTINNFGQHGDAFLAWFGEIPNAEAEAEVLRSEQILSNSTFGSNPTERELNYNSEANRVKIFFWPALGICCWGLFYPHPYDICLIVLLSLPCLGVILAVTSNGRYTLLGDFDVSRIDIGGMMASLPIMVLGLRTLLDTTSVFWYVPLLYAAPIAIVLMAIVYAIERRFSVIIAVCVGALSMIYALALFSYANERLDPGVVDIYPVRVMAADDDGMSPDLTVSKWGGRKSENTVGADLDFVRSVKIGERVCVVVFEGALKVPWYDVRQCPAQLTKQPE